MLSGKGVACIYTHNFVSYYLIFTDIGNGINANCVYGFVFYSGA